MKKIQRDKLGDVWVRWNKALVSGNEAMSELRRVFPRIIHSAWMKSQLAPDVIFEGRRDEKGPGAAKPATFTGKEAES